MDTSLARLQRYNISVTASLADALHDFSVLPIPGQRKRTCLCVVDEGGRLVGLVSERDAIKAGLTVSAAHAPRTLVSTFMVAAEKLSVCSAELYAQTHPLTLASLLARAGYKHCPIVGSDGVAVGILDAIAVSESLCGAATDASSLVVNLTAKPKHVLMVREDDTAAALARLLIDSNTTAAIVRGAGHDRALGGLVTLADILRRVSHSDWHTTPIGAIMTAKDKVKTLDARRLRGAADYLGVLAAMARSSFRHMPIVSCYKRGKKRVVVVRIDIDAK